MGKKNKKTAKKNEFVRICEQCGNEMYSPKRVYQCRYCNWWNGVKKNDKG